MYKIAVIGRPNVGKSTFFNRLVGRRKSIVEPTPGVTRDINKENITIADTEILLQDTGGLVDKIDDVLNDEVQRRALEVARESDLILFLTDATGIHPDDEHFARNLRKLDKPTILVVNKSDSDARESAAADFYSLGINPLCPVSSEHDRGFGALYELLEQYIGEHKKEELALENERKSDEEAGTDSAEDADDGTPIETSDIAGDEKKGEINIAIVGKPNSGKSTLLNTLLEEERSIVSDIAGTTRDPIDAVIEFKGERIRLVDTAGIRRKNRVKENVEYYSVNRAIKAIERADVVILMLDMEAGLTEQDKKIASLIIERKKGIVIGINKWDKRPEGLRWNEYLADLQYYFPVLSYAIYESSCAKKKKDARRLLSVAYRTAKVRETKLDTHILTEVLHEATLRYSVSAGNTTFKVYYAVQTSVSPPTFLLFCNYPDKINSHYRKYLENKLREVFDFQGTPLNIQYKKRGEER